MNSINNLTTSSSVKSAADPALPDRPLKVFHALAMMYVATLIISNALAVKIIMIAGFILPAGIICFPISYIFGDTLTEVYGYARTRSVIWWGFFCLVGMSAFFWIATLLPAAPFWKDQESFAKLFGVVPRIAASSFVANLVGEFLNSFVMSKLKVRTKGKHFGLRAVASTIVGQAADSLIFNVAAFSGVFPFVSVLYIAFSGFVLKSLYEFVAIPLTSRVVKWLKKKEGIDVFDHEENFTPFKMEAL